MNQWRRLSPRMLLVHPVHEVLRQLPVLVGSVMVGTATGNLAWPLAALGFTVAFGMARWFTTSYRIDAENAVLRVGVLRRRQISMPRNRIRSVETDARLLHRLLRLTVVRVSTGREARREHRFELDAVESAQVRQLRTVLLAESLPGAQVDTAEQDRPLARWHPSWLRYGSLSLSGVVVIIATAGVVYQSGVGVALVHSPLVRSGVDAAHRWGVLVAVAVVCTLVIAASVLLSVLWSFVTYANLVLRLDGDALYLRHGLLRVREHTYDTRRLRGGTLRQPLPVRVMGGARLDAVMTGVGGGGEPSVLLPPCPVVTAEGVLTELIGDPDVATGPLRGHGPAAARRRWTRALAAPVAAAVTLGVLARFVAVPGWAWLLLAVLALCTALLAADRVRALGHRVDGGWLVTRSGSLERRRDCIAAAGIVAWTVRQTLLQRRAGVATLIAATAAGRKHYRVIDVPAELAWSIAATASPWVADSVWAHR